MTNISSDRLERVTELERELLRADVRRQRARVLELLHPDFRGFGSSGNVWDAEAVAERLARGDATVGSIEMHDPVAVALGSASILLTYTARRGDRYSLRSSVWVHDGDVWQMLFHQGTVRAERPLPRLGQQASSLLGSDPSVPCRRPGARSVHDGTPICTFRADPVPHRGRAAACACVSVRAARHRPARAGVVAARRRSQVRVQPVPLQVHRWADRLPPAARRRGGEAGRGAVVGVLVHQPVQRLEERRGRRLPGRSRRRPRARVEGRTRLTGRVRVRRQRRRARGEELARVPHWQETRQTCRVPEAQGEVHVDAVVSLGTCPTPRSGSSAGSWAPRPTGTASN